MWKLQFISIFLCLRSALTLTFETDEDRLCKVQLDYFNRELLNREEWALECKKQIEVGRNIPYQLIILKYSTLGPKFNLVLLSAIDLTSGIMTSA